MTTPHTCVVIGALILPLVGGAAFIALRCARDTGTRPTPPALDASAPRDGDAAVPLADDAGSAPNGDATASDEPERWDPPGKTCRYRVPLRTTFETLPDTIIAAAIIYRYNPRTDRFPETEADGGDDITHTVHDCRGDRTTYESPLTEWDRVSLGRTPDGDMDPVEDFDASAEPEVPGGRVRIERHDVRGSRMAVFAAVSIREGFSYTCVGFAAIVRLDAEELVVEAVTPEEIADCSFASTPVGTQRLTELGGRVALLVPAGGGYGENGDQQGAWTVYLSERGGLREIGSVAQYQSPGNYSLSLGGWLPSMDAKLLRGGDSLQVEETWSFKRYVYGRPVALGPVRKVVRVYELQGDRLARWPEGDPTMNADVSHDR